MNAILLRLKKLQQRFYREAAYIQTREGLHKFSNNNPQKRLVLGRGLCMYRYHDFSHIPKSKRNSALESSLSLWSPFEETGHYSYWYEGHVSVWFWDQQQIDPELFSGSTQLIPETVMMSAHRQGCVMQYCESGVELQRWKDSVLMDSLWYDQVPDREAQTKFCTQHLQSVESLLEGKSKLQRDPWPQALTALEWLSLNEKRIVACTAIFLSVILVWQEVRITKAESQVGLVSLKLTQMQDELTPLLAARNKLQGLEVRNSKLVSLIKMPSQARLMTMVSDALPTKKALFREWHYQQGVLRVIVEDPDANTIDYVQALRAESLFKAVTAEQSRGQDRIQLGLSVVAP